jgi:5-methylcytosine-specific restriction endonuclease McrA
VARGSATVRGYDTTWAHYARTWLRRFPYCGQRADGCLHADHSRCVKSGARTRAQVVDHIVPIAAGGARLESGNHQSLCRSCNAAKVRTADVEAIRNYNAAQRRATDVDAIRRARARGPYQRRLAR